MDLLRLLKSEAVKRGRLEPAADIDAATAFALVRDMPYQRASSRRPETIIREWRGTCSGKHYLLQALLAELGLESRLMACTAAVRLKPEEMPPDLRPIVEAAGGRIVDVHNYLVLELPAGEMVVDATFPLASKVFGLTVNETFILGEDQKIAIPPLKKWVVPAGSDPQTFKDELLAEHFTPEELAHREAFIRTFSRLLAAESDADSLL